jgi:phosphate/sulfate permease
VQIEEEEEDSFAIGSLVLPVVAAIVGAFVWQLIAVAFGYELGLVAWGIGGAVGMAAAMAGGRGTGIGIVCSLLALMAIFGGKHMTMASYQSDIVELFGEGGTAEELLAVF